MFLVCYVPYVHFFHEAAGGSIDLAGYLAVDLLGGNRDNTTALEALHIWIVERGVPLSIPRVEERVGIGLGTVWWTASLCRRWRQPEIVMVPLEESAPVIESEGSGIGAAIARIMRKGVPVPTSLVIVLGMSPVFYMMLYAPLFCISRAYPEASTLISGTLRSPVLQEEYV